MPAAAGHQRATARASAMPVRRHLLDASKYCGGGIGMVPTLAAAQADQRRHGGTDGARALGRGGNTMVGVR